MPLKSEGKIAYEAYGNEVGWRNHLGKAMPAWNSLPLLIQRGWHEAYAAAANHALTMQNTSAETENEK